MKLILIGFMGSGKSSVARELAKLHKLELIEMDPLVVKLSNRNDVAEIFSKDGEKAFRSLESELCKKLGEADNCVISPGGGILTSAGNIEALKNKGGKVIYIQSSFETIKERLKNDTSRPLFQDQQKALALYQERLPRYLAAADLIVESEGKSPNDIAKEIGSKICLVIGQPIAQSLSPLMHNAGYKAAGIADKFIFLAREVSPTDLPSFINSIRHSAVRGVSITIPHKETVVPLLDQVSPACKKIGAVNTIVNENGLLKGYNTDVEGIIYPLQQRGSFKGTIIAIFGSGGAARAAAWAALSLKARIHLYLRNKNDAERFKSDFGCTVFDFNDRSQLKDASVIINCTPIGMYPNSEQSILSASEISAHQVVFDTVYNPIDTLLLKNARQCGVKTIAGYEMLVAQGVAQFVHYTGAKEAPKTEMEKVVVERLNNL